MEAWTPTISAASRRRTASSSARSSYFGFSGKENEMWGGLDAMSGNTPHWLKGERYQHFGARAYDPVTCIFMQIDPMAEKYSSVSSFCYCHLNPINSIDLKGEEDSNPQKPVLWGQVANGAASMVGGVSGMVVYYFAAAEAPVPMKLGLAVYGTNCLGTAAIGFTNVVSGFAGESLDLPKTMSGMYGRVADSIVDNEKPIIETAADITEGLAGVFVNSPAGVKTIENVSRISVVQTALDVGLRLSNVMKSPKSTASYDRTQPQVDNTNVVSSSKNILTDENRTQKR